MRLGTAQLGTEGSFRHGPRRGRAFVLGPRDQSLTSDPYYALPAESSCGVGRGGTVKKDIWGRGCGGHVEVCPERPVIPEGPLSRLWDPSPTPVC